jgi:hypothetical protein
MQEELGGGSLPDIEIQDTCKRKATTGKKHSMRACKKEVTSRRKKSTHVEKEDLTTVGLGFLYFLCKLPNRWHENCRTTIIREPRAKSL